MSEFYVGSEVGQLKRVLLHRPERALNHLTPTNCHELLFDDVLAVERAGIEHDVFANTLREQGVDVYLLHDLLVETLAVPEAKQWLLQTQISEYRLGYQFSHDVRNYLSTLDNESLAEILLGGLSYIDLPIQSTSMMQAMHERTDFVIEPLPNHLFTRDTSCWVYGGVSLNPMAKPARQRETNHLRAIYRWHPEFSASRFINYLGDEMRDYDNAMIEGGDVLVIGKGSVLIGMSERTTPQGVEQLARSLLFSGQAKEVIAIKLPKERSCMHLDTVMTHMDIHTFSVYPTVMRPDLQCWKMTLKGDNAIQVTEQSNFLNAIEHSLDVGPLNIITTGGDSYAAEREQWNDANNVLTIRPGVVISYEGNSYTNEKYDKAGITVLPIPGDQLGRGRGGARCMSCPLEREGI